MGESQCPVLNEEDMLEFSTPNTLVVHDEEPEVQESEAQKWLGLYCSTYKRFHCTGEQMCRTGACITADSFLKHLAETKGGKP